MISLHQRYLQGEFSYMSSRLGTDSLMGKRVKWGRERSLSLACLARGFNVSLFPPTKEPIDSLPNK